MSKLDGITFLLPLEVIQLFSDCRINPYIYIAQLELVFFLLARGWVCLHGEERHRTKLDRLNSSTHYIVLKMIKASAALQSFVVALNLPCIVLISSSQEVQCEMKMGIALDQDRKSWAVSEGWFARPAGHQPQGCSSWVLLCTLGASHRWWVCQPCILVDSLGII